MMMKYCNGQKKMLSTYYFKENVKKILSMIEKPSLDHRQYDSFKLERNDLSVLLISDPKADKSACAMDVNVGHFSDKDTAGLAHFLEHMLFMVDPVWLNLFQGTEEYPLENEYSSYLSENGGYSNAFTSTGFCSLPQTSQNTPIITFNAIPLLCTAPSTVSQNFSSLHCLQRLRWIVSF